MMSGDQVLAVLGELEAAGAEAWIDGGWGVDALLGRQTRQHDDLDLVVDVAAITTCRRVFEADGFLVERDWLPSALAFRHPDGMGIDLHPVQPTADGGGDQTQLDGITQWHYPPPTTGSISGVPVRCCTVECQIASHLGYEPDDQDRADMAELARHFGIELPVPYATGLALAAAARGGASIHLGSVSGVHPSRGHIHPGVGRTPQLADVRGQRHPSTRHLQREYAGLDLDLAYGVNVALTGEYRTASILTLDRRDFRAIRPLTPHPAFQLLPDDT